MARHLTSFLDDVTSNFAALEAFWKRTTFHDMAVMSIDRTSGRVIVTLEAFILVLTGVNHYDGELDELPDSWTTHRLLQSKDGATLTVELECGRFTARFQNVRLLRRNDYAVLIPPLDR